MSELKQPSGWNVSGDEMDVYVRFIQKKFGVDKTGHFKDGDSLFGKDKKKFRCWCGEWHDVVDDGKNKTLHCEELDITVRAKTTPTLMSKFIKEEVVVIKESKEYAKVKKWEGVRRFIAKVVAYYEIAQVIESLYGILFLALYPLLFVWVSIRPLVREVIFWVRYGWQKLWRKNEQEG